MPARKVNGSWYVDVWVDVPGKGRKRLRKKSPIQTKKGAQQYEQELVESALSSGDEEQREAITFRQLAVEFMERHVRVQCKYATFVSYESALVQHLIPFFGSASVEEVSGRDIAMFQAKLLKDGKAPGTVRNIMTVLSSALHVAKEWEYLEAVPAFRMPKKVPTRFRFLTAEECERVEAAATKYWRPMIRFARKTGLRIGEITACDWEQINFESATVNVDRSIWRKKLGTPKGGSSRLVDLSSDTVAVLREVWERQGRPRRGLVFPSRVGGHRQETKCDKGLRRAARHAEMEPFGWHVLRHTFASHLVMAGVPLPVVQALLGHTDIRLTMRYAHLSPGQTAKAVQMLDLAGPSGAHAERAAGCEAGANIAQARSASDLAGHYLGIGDPEEGR